jgi:hypothetical protein
MSILVHRRLPKMIGAMVASSTVPSARLLNCHISPPSSVATFCCTSVNMAAAASDIITTYRGGTRGVKILVVVLF